MANGFDITSLINALRQQVPLQESPLSTALVAPPLPETAPPLLPPALAALTPQVPQIPGLPPSPAPQRSQFRQFLGDFLSTIGAGIQAGVQAPPGQEFTAAFGQALTAPEERRAASQRLALEQARQQLLEAQALRQAQLPEEALTRLRQQAEQAEAGRAAQMERLLTELRERGIAREDIQKFQTEQQRERLATQQEIAKLNAQTRIATRNVNFTTAWQEAFTRSHGRPPTEQELMKMQSSIARETAKGSFVTAVDPSGQFRGFFNPTTKEIVEAPSELKSLQKARLPFDVSKASLNAQSGLRSLQVVRSFLTPDKIRETLLLAAIPGAPGARAFEAARKELTDVITRLRTGAALNQQEQSFYAGLIPSLLDLTDPQAIEFKLAQLENLYNSFVNLTPQSQGETVPFMPSPGGLTLPKTPALQPGGRKLSPAAEAFLKELRK